MAEKILKQNKIPGCERLTRPEEIKALSKYLRKVKEVLEENTDLENTPLEIPGKTTGQVHDINSLPEEYEKLDTTDNIDSLPEGYEKLDTTDNIESLYDSVIGIEDTRNVELENYKDTLEDTRENSLSEYKDTIEDTRDTELEDYKDTIVDARENSLPDYKDTIEDTRDTELENYKDTIVDDNNPELEDYKDTIEDTRDTELENYKDTIVDDNNPELEDYKDIIVDSRENSLPDYKDTIVDDNNPELENYKDTIVDDKENSLSDYKDTIVDSRDTELEDYKDTIVDARENSLPDYKDTIVDDNNPELEDYKDTIVDSRDTELEDYKNKLSSGDFHEPTLEDTVINISEANFYDPESKTNTLSTDGEARVDGEYDYGNEQNHKNYKDQLNSGEFHDPSLEDTIINMQYGPGENPRTDGDYDYIDNSINYGEADPIIQLKAKNKFERHRKTIERPDNSEEDARTDGIYGNNEFNTDGSPGYYGSFDNVIPKIENPYNNSPESLYDAVLGLYGPSENPRTDGDYDYIDNNVDFNNSDPIIQKKYKNKFESHQEVIERPDDNDTDHQEHNYIGDISKLSDKDLYDLVIELAYDKESLLDVSDEWKEKLAALVSTYLNPGNENKPISPRNAHRFEDEFNAMLSNSSDGTARTDGKYDFLDNYIKYNNGNPDSILLEKARKKFESHQEKVERPYTSAIDARDNDRYEYINLGRDEDGYATLSESGEKRFIEHTADEYKDVPAYEIPIDTTELKIEYIRYAAEESVGWGMNKNTRKLLLAETLWTLILERRYGEISKGTNRDRLPGESVREKTIGNNLIDSITSGKILDTANELISKYIGIKNNPLNRPDKLLGTTTFEMANSRYEANLNVGSHSGVFKLWDKIIDSLSSIGNTINSGLDEISGNGIFNKRYLRGGGISTTLKDLCEGKESSSILSVEELLDTLKNSPYITTPTKFGTIQEGRYGTQTLDSNSYWEVVIEPFCDDYLNGGYSFLPCFNEINVINYAAHGVRTAYNKWIPISNFELQKSKLTTKTVGLYDGEFSFPLSAELINEIRFTIVDDQYKSWRNYFQKCMDVAVYNSESHDRGYYNQFSIDEYINRGGVEELITAVDKSMVCVAFYKNITFRIKIYIMTPQYSTIRRFDLLCVLKDFTEEFSGDVDTGGVDLNVTFSIVGENPDGAKENNEDKQFLDTLSNDFQSEERTNYMLSILEDEDIEEDEFYLNQKQIINVISN